MQQVNLYVESLRPKKVVLSLIQTIGLQFVLLLVLAGISVLLVKQEAEAGAHLAKEQGRLKNLQSLVSEKEKAVQMLRRDDELAALNVRLKERLEARKKLLHALGNIITTSDYPFSSLLAGLARHPVDALWLTRMQVTDNGRRLALEGKTADAEKIPFYLQQLRSESAFLGRTFNGLSVTNETESSTLHFELSSDRVVNTKPGGPR